MWNLKIPVVGLEEVGDALMGGMRGWKMQTCMNRRL